MKKLKDIIRNLGLKDNEIIITEEEYKLLKQVETSATKTSTTTKKTTQKKHKKRKGRKPAEIVWTDTKGKGQIRKRDSGELVFYYYDKNNHRPYSKRGTYEELVQFGEYFEKTGYNKDKFYKKNYNNGSISKLPNGSYSLRKNIKNNTIYFGVYSDKRLAEEVRLYLQFKNWDLDYEPKNLTPATTKRLGVDGYYRTMKPIMSADKEFQNYKIMKGVLI